VIARLEETYNVDLVFDGFIETYDSLPPEELFDSTTTNVRLRNLESIKEWKRKPLTLNFIKKLDVLGNKEQNIRYYFECNKELYCMMFAERNPLLHVLDKRIEDNNNVLNILGAVNHRPLYANSNFWYNTIYDNWILKD